MTPKDKARKLVNVFFPFVDTNSLTYLDAIHSAKQCALKCVDEILEEAKWWHTSSSYEEATDFVGGLMRVQYWESVKSEIEKL